MAETTANGIEPIHVIAAAVAYVCGDDDEDCELEVAQKVIDKLRQCGFEIRSVK